MFRVGGSSMLDVRCWLLVLVTGCCLLLAVNICWCLDGTVDVGWCLLLICSVIPFVVVVTCCVLLADR